MAQDDDIRTGALVVTRGQRTPQLRRNAERGEEVGRDARGAHTLRLTGAAHPDTVLAVRRHGLERPVAVTHVHELGARVSRDGRELLWIRVRKSAQEHRVGHAEHGRRRADAEGEGEDGHDGVTGRAAKGAQTMPHVLSQALPPQASPRAAGRLAHDPYVAELAARCRLGAVAGFSARHPIAHRHGEVHLDLGVEFLLAAAAPQRHDALPSSAGERRMLAMADDSVSQRDRSVAR